MKSTHFWREFEFVAVTIECPYCGEEIKHSTAEAKEIFTDLWYPQEATLECPECGSEFLVEYGEDNL